MALIPSKPVTPRWFGRLTTMVEWTPPIFWMFCMIKGFMWNFAAAAMLTEEMWPVFQKLDKVIRILGG